MKLVQFNILVRQWMRGGVSTAVSLVSLSLGLICSTILLLFAVEEFRAADALTPDPTDKYMLMIEQQGQKGRFDNLVLKFDAVNIAERCPQIVDYALIKECNNCWQGEQLNTYDKKSPRTIAVTPSFTKYYKIPMIEGNLDSVLAYPDRIAITQTYAAQLFPNKKPIGQTITSQEIGFNSDTTIRNFTVTAIVDNSMRSALKFRAIYQFPPSDMQQSYQLGMHHAVYTMVRGFDPVNLSKPENRKIMDLSLLGAIRFDPIDKAYLVDNTTNTSTSCILTTRDKSSLYIGITIAFAILVIAAFNYINITLTRSASRLKNLAGQRIMGATKWNVRGQIVADTAINVALALILALVFLPLSMEGFNSFMDSSINMSDLLYPLNAFCVLGLLIVLITIPSVSLIIKFSIRNPLETFKNPEGRKLRAAQPLVITQIVISVVLLTFGMNVSRQMTHVANSLPMADEIIVVNSVTNDPLPKEFYDRVKASATTKKIVAGSLNAYTQFNTNGNDTIYYHSAQALPGIFGMFDIRIIEGRIFEEKYNQDYSQASECVVTQSMSRALGVKGSLLGLEIFNGRHRIVGVCPDIRTVDAKTHTRPTVFTYSPWIMHNNSGPSDMYVRVEQGTVDKKIAEMQDIFTKTSEEGTLMPRMMTVADLSLVQNPEIGRMQTMIDVFTTISFLLTAFGLFGLSWYMVERRRREIAIRKTYGATVVGMVAMLCRSFLWQSLIAIVIALPAAYLISGYWLEGFVFRVDNAWWVLAVTSAISLVVIFATVIGQTIRAALTNPVKYIKTE